MLYFKINFLCLLQEFFLQTEELSLLLWYIAGIHGNFLPPYILSPIFLPLSP